MQDAFFAAVKDTIDSLGLEVWHSSTSAYMCVTRSTLRSLTHAMQEEEAIESVVEEFEIQKVDMSDVVLLSDPAQLNRYG